MTSFTTFDLAKPLSDAIHQLGFTIPTPIQAQTIPIALTGKDILGSAQTGSGKTAAFGIPLVNHLLENPTHQALILVPTRELALQVLRMMKDLLGKTNIHSVLLIGGESLFKQIQQLRNRPRLIIGTPGRVNDLIDRRCLNLSHTRFFVLDEMDRMLDMGFSVQIDKILQHLPREKQTLLFSATVPPKITTLSQKYLHQPVRIAVDCVTQPTTQVKQDVIWLKEQEKFDRLTTELNERDGSIIVFVKTKRGAERITQQLRREDHSVNTIHGDLRQRERSRVIQDFRNQKYRIIVATDIASRGLDIDHIKHVINYDVSQCPEDYIHRIGRTARAGAEGFAISFVTNAERLKWQAIDKLMNPEKKFSSEKPKTQQQGKKPWMKFKKGAPRKFEDGKESRDFKPHQKSSDSKRTAPAKTGRDASSWGHNGSTTARKPGSRPFSREGASEQRSSRPSYNNGAAAPRKSFKGKVWAKKR